MDLDSIGIFEDGRIEIGGKPIDGGAGEDIRGDGVFDALDTMVRRMDTDGPNAVPWANVARDGLSILETKSKDLLVGVWVAYALARIEGLSGLAVGLGILDGMVEQHWDGLQPPPKRERARVGALEWLVGRVTPMIADWPSAPAGYPAALFAYEKLDAVDRIASEKFTKESVSLGELVRALRPQAEEARRAFSEARARAAAPPPEPTPAPPPTPVAASSEPVTVSAAPPPPVSPPVPQAVPVPANVAVPQGTATTVGADLNRSVSQLTEAIRAHALAVRQSDLTDPRGYILTRTAAWLAIRQPPPVQGGRSAIPPPDATRIGSIEALAKAGKPADGVQAAESLLASSPFFIEANLLSARTLVSMGPTYIQARMAIATATAGFLLRFPELKDIGFSDGKPFVSDEVMQWLGEEGALGQSGGQEADLSDPVEAALATARGLAQSGQPRDAIAHLASSLSCLGDGRNRLRMQLGQAKLLLDFDMPVAAWALLDHLDAEINRREIDLWEPALAATAAEFRIRASTLPQVSKVIPDDRRRLALDEARVRLARCDVSAAARLLS